MQMFISVSNLRNKSSNFSESLKWNRKSSNENHIVSGNVPLHKFEYLWHSYKVMFKILRLNYKHKNRLIKTFDQQTIIFTSKITLKKKKNFAANPFCVNKL